jgi:hypothetical protein
VRGSVLIVIGLLGGAIGTALLASGEVDWTDPSMPVKNDPDHQARNRMMLKRAGPSRSPDPKVPTKDL